MAEGGGDLLSTSLQKLDDELTCPVCQEHFKEPRVLPCLHYYCKKCIADLITRAPRGRPFNCPECRREAQAVNNDPESFPAAFFVNRMEDVYSVMKKAEPKENVTCENCSEQPSVSFCQHCSEYLCKECVKAHKRMRKFSSTHVVISIDSLRATITKSPADSLPVVHQEVKCSKHKDEPLKLYCHDCHKLVCRDCTLIDHKEHKYAFVVDAAPKCKLVIEEKAKSVKKISSDLKCAVKSLNDSEKKLSDHSTATMKVIDDAIDKVVSKAQQKRVELKEEARRMVNKTKEEIAMQEKNAQLAVGEVESLLDFLNRNLEKATDQELLSLQKQMSDQADRASQLYTNPTVKFPVPQLPQLEVRSSAKVMQVIQDDISVADKAVEVTRVYPMESEPQEPQPSEPSESEPSQPQPPPSSYESYAYPQAEPQPESYAYAEPQPSEPPQEESYESYAYPQAEPQPEAPQPLQAYPQPSDEGWSVEVVEPVEPPSRPVREPESVRSRPVRESVRSRPVEPPVGWSVEVVEPVRESVRSRPVEPPVEPPSRVYEARESVSRSRVEVEPPSRVYEARRERERKSRQKK